jgi:uncharacterized protein YbjQ (UPF0145 family)
MLVTTTDGLPGYEIQLVLGQVFGLSIQEAAFSGHSVPSALRKCQEAMDMMVYEARRRGATAIVGMRFDSAQLNDHRVQICSYGTAVGVEPVTEAARKQYDEMVQRGWQPQLFPAPQPGQPAPHPLPQPPQPPPSPATLPG